MKNSEKLIQEKYNGIHPVCGCGCGEKTVYDHSSKDFGKFKRGHQSRVIKDYFGDPKNPDRVNKIISTRKQKFASGEYDHIVKAIKENRKDPELGNKISKGAKGVPKPKPEGFGVGRIQSEVTKEKMSKQHLQNWEEGNIGRRHYTSKLEDKMEEILKNNLINYQKTFYAKSIKAFYDFFIPDTNIIIEVDGDFFHSNPKFYPNGPIYKTQIQNDLRDQEKNQWAKDNGYKLLRFWETDINTNPTQVIETLKKELGIL
jgi:very-short-patch-repair endonuclease